MIPEDWMIVDGYSHWHSQDNQDISLEGFKIFGGWFVLNLVVFSYSFILL